MNNPTEPTQSETPEYATILHPSEGWGLKVRQTIPSASSPQLDAYELMLLALDKERNTLRAQVAELTRERDDKHALAQNYSERLKEAQQINASLHESGRNHHEYCATLTREVAQLRADKGRLDFILRPGNSLGVAEVESVNGRAIWWFVRDGIDAAMSARNEKETK